MSRSQPRKSENGDLPDAPALTGKWELCPAKDSSFLRGFQVQKNEVWSFFTIFAPCSRTLKQKRRYKSIFGYCNLRNMNFRRPHQNQQAGNRKLRRCFVIFLFMSSLVLLTSLTTPKASAYEDHSPIEIGSNTQFDEAHGVNGGGSGTEEDPYIIENWAIDASSTHGIYIHDTTMYYIIRNCLIENSYGTSHNGIRLGDGSGSERNGRIENCVLDNNSTAIYLYGDVSNVSIDNVTITNGSSTGIAAGTSGSYYAYNIWIENSRISNQPWAGIYSYGWNGSSAQNQNLTIKNNIIEFSGGGSGAGIYLRCSRNNLIENNVIHDSGSHGIWLRDHSSDTTIRNNRVYNNGGEAQIYVDWYGSGAVIDNNETYGSGRGIYLRRSPNSYIWNNTCHDGGDLIYLYDGSGGASIENNLCYNGSNGIYCLLYTSPSPRD